MHLLGLHFLNNKMHASFATFKLVFLISVVIVPIQETLDGLSLTAQGHVKEVTFDFEVLNFVFLKNTFEERVVERIVWVGQGQPEVLRRDQVKLYLHLVCLDMFFYIGVLPFEWILINFEVPQLQILSKIHIEFGNELTPVNRKT